jgi:putative endonuclease
MGNGGERPGTAERRHRYRRGQLYEWIAQLFLVGKGYRILARREKTGAGEIDVIATRGERLAFVEVKLRPTLDDAYASITPRQSERVRRAADLWLARHPRYQGHEIGFDVILLVPRRWPVHIENGL